MPPLVGVAVNVTDVPEQIVVELPDMDTDGVTVELTVMLIELEVAVAGEAQLKLEVMITVTTSPLAKVVVVKTSEFVPALVPFTCHW